MEEVRRLRLEKGWNQTELAYHAKLAPSVISLLETGKREPNASTLRKLAVALGVTIPDLFRESGSSKAPTPSSPNGGERGDQETEAREETLRAMEEQDAALGKNLAGLLDQQLQWQIEKLRSRLDRAESPGARNDAAKDFGDWYFSSSLWIEQIRRHLPKIRVPELVRAKEAARVAVGEFAPNFTSPQRHEEITHKLAGIEDATAARDTPPTGPSRRVVFRGGPSWGEQAADSTEAEAPTKGA